MAYFVYILECVDKTFYVGSTNNIEKRLIAHNTLKIGARYTRVRRPVILRYSETFETRSEAMKREIALKRLPRSKKEVLVLSIPPSVNAG